MTRARMPAGLTAAILVALLVLLPWVFDGRHTLGLLSQAGIASLLCLSYWLLMGQGGLLSFGHAVYSGAGAYLAIHTLRLIEAGLWLPVSLLPLASGLAAAGLATVFGWLATRQSPTAFAMITLALGEMAWAVALMFPTVFGGEAGIAADRTRGPLHLGWSLGPAVQMYALVAVYTVAGALCIHGFTRTPAGQLLQAVRDNPVRVAFVGHDPRRVRWLAFVVSAFFAGVAGGLAALLHEIVTPEVLGTQRSAEVLVFTFVGGVGSLWGALIGGVLMVLGSVMLPTLTPAWLLYLGLLFLAMVRWAPGGVVGWLQAPKAAQPLSWPLRLAQVIAWGVCLAGWGALVEMAYRWHLADTVGSQVRYLGLPLDVHALGHWAGAAVLALVAGLALRRLGRQAQLQREPA